MADAPVPSGVIDVLRLIDLLERRQLKPFTASKAAGLGGDYVRDLIRGRVKEPSARSLAALAKLLETTPEYLLGLHDAAIAPRPRFRGEQSHGHVDPEAPDPGLDPRLAPLITEAQADAELVHSLVARVSLTLNKRLRDHLSAIETPGADFLAEKFAPNTTENLELNRLAEFSRSFGLITEQTATALTRLGMLRWYAEKYPSAVDADSSRAVVIRFLDAVGSPFHDYAGLTADELRAEILLACSTLVLEIIGRTDAAHRLHLAHAGVAVDAATGDAWPPDDDRIKAFTQSLTPKKG